MCAHASCPMAGNCGCFVFVCFRSFVCCCFLGPTLEPGGVFKAHLKMAGGPVGLPESFPEATGE